MAERPCTQHSRLRHLAELAGCPWFFHPFGRARADEHLLQRVAGIYALQLIGRSNRRVIEDLSHASKARVGEAHWYF
jgi:hypothetical protein